MLILNILLKMSDGPMLSITILIHFCIPYFENQFYELVLIFRTSLRPYSQVTQVEIVTDMNFMPFENLT